MNEKNLSTDKNVTSENKIQNKINLIIEKQSLPEHVVIKLLSARGKLRKDNDGRMISAKNEV